MSRISTDFKTKSVKIREIRGKEFVCALSCTDLCKRSINFPIIRVGVRFHHFDKNLPQYHFVDKYHKILDKSPFKEKIYPSFLAGEKYGKKPTPPQSLQNACTGVFLVKGSSKSWEVKRRIAHPVPSAAMSENFSKPRGEN